MAIITNTGGFGPNGTSDECFAFEDCQWVKTSWNLASKRRYSGLASVNGSADVIGGEESSKIVHRNIERLGGEPGTFLLNEPTSRHCAVVHRSGLVLVIGGLVGNDPFSAKVVEVGLKTYTSMHWSTFWCLKCFNVGRQLHSCQMLDQSTVIVAGGRNFRGLMSSVELFDLETKIWREVKELQLPG